MTFKSPLNTFKYSESQLSLRSNFQHETPRWYSLVFALTASSVIGSFTKCVNTELLFRPFTLTIVTSSSRRTLVCISFQPTDVTNRRTRCPQVNVQRQDTRADHSRIALQHGSGPHRVKRLNLTQHHAGCRWRWRNTTRHLRPYLNDELVSPG